MWCEMQTKFPSSKIRGSERGGQGDRDLKIYPLVPNHLTLALTRRNVVLFRVELLMWLGNGSNPLPVTNISKHAQ